MTVSWSAATDSGSGIAPYTSDGVPYKIVYQKSTSASTKAVPPANCGSGHQLEVESASEVTNRKVVQGTGGGGSLDVAALSSGYTYAYRMCVTDLAGNRSSGVSKSAKPL